MSSRFDEEAFDRRLDERDRKAAERELAKYRVVRVIDNRRPGVPVDLSTWKASFVVSLPERGIFLHSRVSVQPNGRLLSEREEFLTEAGNPPRRQLSMNCRDVYSRHAGEAIHAWCRRARILS